MDNSIIDQILTEWAYRVPDGMPNPKNALHMIQLDEAMSSLKLPRKFKVGLLRRMRGLQEGGACGPGQNPERDGCVAADGSKGSGKSKEKTDTKKQSSNISQEQLDSVDGKAKDGGMNGTVKAPGTASSTVNEIGVGMGMDCLSKGNPDACLDEKLSKSKLGKKYNKPKYRKMIMQSARMEKIRVENHIKENGMNPKATTVSHVWGSKDSLDATANKLEELKKQGVTEVNGIPIDQYKNIVLGGGGGDDPTDTLVVLVDESQKPPKVEILHTSNKMSSEDIQANGSPNEEITQTSNAAKELVESKEDKVKVDKADKVAKKKIATARVKQKQYIGAQGTKMNEHVQNDATADRILARMENGSDGNPKGISSAEGKYLGKMLIRKEVKVYMKENGIEPPISPEQKRTLLRVYTNAISQPGADLRDEDVQILSRLYKDEKYSTGRDGADKPIFSEQKMKSYYEKQTDAINENREMLNNIKPGLGDKVFTRRMIKRLHLDVAEGHDPGGIPNKNFTLNMGEYPRKDLKRGKDGSLYEKKNGKWYKDGESEPSDLKDKDLQDLDCGVTADAKTHQSCLGLKEGEKIEDGFDVRVGDIEKEGESYKAIIYDRKGNVVAFQTCRSKSGPGGAVNDTIQWSPNYQKCMAKHTVKSGRCG